ncbi:hypothetical protein L249_8365, partial [Ophiocordyceps polyrhachis-furcata BCC 54312]
MGLSRDSSSSSLSRDHLPDSSTLYPLLLSDSGYLYTFNLFFTAFLFTFRPTNYLIRTVSSDAFQQSDPLFLKKFPLSATMGNDQKYSFAKLSGSGNYTHWALRMDSLLIREKLQGALGSIAHNKSEDALALIRLQLEDGPLTQIMHLRSAKEAWDKLKDLYNPALRIDSLLIREKLQGALGSIAHNKSEDALALIRLQLEDGPLTQIMHLRSAKEAWDKLKDLYNPVSFTSNFLLTKELLEMGRATPYNIEDYLNR